MARAKTTALSMSIAGMTCEHCASAVDDALVRVAGVRSASADLASGRAEVEADAGTDWNTLRAAVEARGYRVTDLRARARSDGPAETSGRDDAELDLVVVGSGAAGVAAAIRAAERGARVAVVESGTLGGTCVNVGCVPSKALIRAAEAYAHAGHSTFAGVRTRKESLDLAAVVADKDSLVGALRRAKYEDVLAAHPSIRLVRGRARLDRAGDVEVDGVALRAKRVVLAMGASPWAPPIAGLSETPHLDSTSLLQIERLPTHLIVIGGGAVGLELAQAFLRFGSAVSVIEALPRLLPTEDADLGGEVGRALAAEGMEIITGAEVRAVSGDVQSVHVAVGTQAGQRVIEGDRLLVAAGRRPRTDSLGLLEAGVQLGKKGEVLVDASLRTSLPHVYAAGDVIGDPAFVYVAAYAGRLAADNALGSAARAYDISLVPRVTFTDPGVASIGLTEAQARARHGDVAVSTLPMSAVPRAIAARDTRGLVKLVADMKDQRILGAHIVAPEAGEMITEVALAMRAGMSYSDLAAVMHPYLTNAEAIRLACLGFDRDVAKLSCCAT